jgi:antitoxin FitA
MNPLAASAADAIVDSMAQLLVRNIDETIVEALRRRAARHGRSAEAEHREILCEVLLRRRGRSLKQHLTAMPDVGDDADFIAPRPLAPKVDV